MLIFKVERETCNVKRVWYNALRCRKAGIEYFIRRGRVVWPSAHAWRACFPQGNEGSNPSLSAWKMVGVAIPPPAIYGGYTETLH